jgi:hypothetical protein
VSNTNDGSNHLRSFVSYYDSIFKVQWPCTVTVATQQRVILDLRNHMPRAHSGEIFSNPVWEKEKTLVLCVRTCLQ